MDLTRCSRYLALGAGMLATILGCDPALGPCSHSYREPILHVSRVTNAATGQPLATVFLDSLTYQGAAGGEVSWFQDSPVIGVSLEGDRVRCDLACAFGSQTGVYRFRLSASGYHSKRLEVTADFGVFHGGCPSWNDEGTRITAVLLPL